MTHLVLDDVRHSTSVTRRWLVEGAEPVQSYLNSAEEFVPADLLLYWSHSPGSRHGEYSFSSYAWPEERSSFTSAQWNGSKPGEYGRPHLGVAPGWVQALGEHLFAELTGAKPPVLNLPVGLTQQYASPCVSIDERWNIVHTRPITGNRGPGHHTPVSVRISWDIHYDMDSNESPRYRAMILDADGSLIDDQGGLERYGFQGDMPAWEKEILVASLDRAFGLPVPVMAASVPG